MGLDRAPIEFQTFYFSHVWLVPPINHVNTVNHINIVNHVNSVNILNSVNSANSVSSVSRGATSFSDGILFFVFVFVFVFVSFSFPAPRLQSIALQFTDFSLIAHESVALKEFSDGKLPRRGSL